MTISKTLETAPTVKESIKMASESAAEEAELELDQLLQQFEDWKKENKGGWKDFLKSNKETKIKRISLKDGTDFENENSFARLADDYEADIQVIYIDGVKEDFGSYVKRMGGIVYDD